MQLSHLVSLIGERKLFMLVFGLPENYETSDYVEPADNFVQTTGTQAGLTVELMKNGKLFTLGHRGDPGPLVSLARKDGTAVEVSQNEVLMPNEVGQLLVEYVRTSSIDTSGWALREIPLADDNRTVLAGSSLREQPEFSCTAIADERADASGRQDER
jgi:hypothetical protein